MKQDINNIKNSLNHLISNRYLEESENKQTLSLKEEIIEILFDKILDEYTSSNSIYNNKEKIIINTIIELEKIKIPVYDLDEKTIKKYKLKYDLTNNEELDKEVSRIINQNFYKVASQVIKQLELETKESERRLQEDRIKTQKDIEDILYKNLSGLIKEGYPKDIVTKLLKDGSFYSSLLAEEHMKDTKELQEIYIKVSKPLSKRLMLIPGVTFKEQERQRQKQKNGQIPFIWKVYGVIKLIGNINKK